MGGVESRQAACPLSAPIRIAGGLAAGILRYQTLIARARVVCRSVKKPAPLPTATPAPASTDATPSAAGPVAEKKAESGWHGGDGVKTLGEVLDWLVGLAEEPAEEVPHSRPRSLARAASRALESARCASERRRDGAML